MQPVIRVDRLSKQYRIGVGESGIHCARHATMGPYRTLRETIMEAVSAPVNRLRRAWRGRAGPGAAPPAKPAPDTIWPLRDVCFEVKHGEVVGIVGRNGAGKSTLLKILSRITEPTSGRVELRGRVGCLLEVGTGFHRELTGRENVYLNGAILGMTRREITRKFDEIAAFAEIDQFLDTPVKRYSSGMYVRLGFAVAAHLEPEVLLVDEVLAVGDAAFQKKCLGKMTAMTRQGQTVFFVSHNMAAVEGLCTRALFLSSGRLKGDGAPRQVIDQYIQSCRLGARDTGPLGATGDGQVELVSFDCWDDQGQPVNPVTSGQDVTFRLLVRHPGPAELVRIRLGIENAFGMRVGLLTTELVRQDLWLDGPLTEVLCRAPDLPLVPGNYHLSVELTGLSGWQLSLPNVTELRVENGDFFKTGKMMDATLLGSVLLHHGWEARRVKEA
jgi:lipopolysaccharide transport system ATP-binding protein